MPSSRKKSSKSKSHKAQEDDHDSDHTPRRENTLDNDDNSSVSTTGSHKPGSQIQNVESPDISPSKPKDNPHSAQSILNQNLDPDSHVSRLNQLADSAAALAAQRKSRALLKRAKNRKKAATKASQTKASRSKKVSKKHKSVESSDSESSTSQSSSSSSSSSSDDSNYGKKQKAKKSSETASKF